MKFKYIFLSILIVSVSFILTVLFLQKQNSQQIVTGNSLKLPTNVEAIEQSTNSGATSPDGKKSVSMQAKTKGNTSTYTFYTGNDLLLTRTLTNGKMSIPFNTWSIDDKHLFLKEEVDGNINFFVEPEDINVTEKFKEKFPEYIFQDATGWASESLLVINANDGQNDISYWFDITSKTFIRLSNRFN